MWFVEGTVLEQRRSHLLVAIERQVCVTALKDIRWQLDAQRSVLPKACQGL
jgi:hypothetical protein